jgi:two-component system sensor histidine kinase HupT/HoxJ
MAGAKTATDPTAPGGLDSLGEEARIEVIRKMDEVYSDLVQYEVALEEKNTALEETQRFVFSVLASMSDILVVCDRDGRIEVVNRAMVTFCGRAEADLIGTPLFDLFADAEARASAGRLFAAQGAAPGTAGGPRRVWRIASCPSEARTGPRSRSPSTARRATPIRG